MKKKATSLAVCVAAIAVIGLSSVLLTNSKYTTTDEVLRIERSYLLVTLARYVSSHEFYFVYYLDKVCYNYLEQ